MISEEEARLRVLTSVTAGRVESLPLFKALGRHAGTDVLATVPLPGFDNSTMDGYAVRAADTVDSTIALPVIGEQPAGKDRGLHCGAGQAVRLFTGAPMPTGADAVIMQEDVVRQGDAIFCKDPVTERENVRFAGADLCAGQVILRLGQVLTPGRIGVLASQGLAEVLVHRTPRVAVLSTGDELAPAGRPLGPGEIYNSNGAMLQALLAAQGILETQTLHCADSLESTQQALEQLLDSNDVLLLSGGVSVGDHDHVKPALLKLGITPELWRVKVKPGKPFLFARHGTKLIFGLPGNPVSSYVTYQIFVRAALMKWMGCPDRDLEPVRLPAVCMEALQNDGPRPHYLRGVFQQGQFTSRGLQESHALFSLSQANALLRLDAGESVSVGERVQVML